jgi:heme oxygenase
MILQELKEQTRSHHEQVERAIDIPSRLQSRQSYEELLAGMYGLYAPLEERLAAIDGLSGPDYNVASRRKTEKLISDLSALGQSPQEIEHLSRCEALPDLSTAARGLGCLYVLEGAALGGQIITKLVRDRLGLTPDNGCRFFAGDAERTPVAWGAFRQHLTSYVEGHPNCQAEVIAAASETFQAFEHWLGKQG